MIFCTEHQKLVETLFQRQMKHQNNSKVVRMSLKKKRKRKKDKDKDKEKGGNVDRTSFTQ